MCILELICKLCTLVTGKRRTTSPPHLREFGNLKMDWSSQEAILGTLPNGTVNAASTYLLVPQTDQNGSDLDLQNLQIVEISCHEKGA